MELQRDDISKPFYVNPETWDALIRASEILNAVKFPSNEIYWNQEKQKFEVKTINNQLERKQ